MKTPSAVNTLAVEQRLQATVVAVWTSVAVMQ
jgi:hypothetical protein